ncbi:MULTISPECIES: DUF6073 family protein [Actinomadura]|uniref:Uncharacterized protein n=1 Tax=Actinomadura litoris TaxID=2678616 RepID=A0A7K1LE39_9ACTN|nr:MULTISPECIES: DUF6073 family protein [Actinomadura]MBT2212740.1 hypothetical protein [Actinomadura sp. NEAU-AAG7]MUN42700.1 hypothetical protein [Actinomadura litoris]
MDTQNILQQLMDRGLAPGIDGATLSSADVVKGHESAWGGAGNLYPIRPYTLTPAALESFTVRERIHVSVDGLGEDVVDLYGLGIYRRHDPKAAEGRELDWAGAIVTAQFLSLQVTGHSDVFGQVKVSNSPHKAEGARVKPSPAPGGGHVMPIKDCVTSLYPRFEIEDLGTTIDTGDEVVRLESRIAMVPPVGDVSRTSRRYPLYDEAGRPVGELIAADIEIGALLHHVPITSVVVPEALAAVVA